jgi:hypothetical protein
MVTVCSSSLGTSKQIAEYMGISFALVQTDPKLVLIFMWQRTMNNCPPGYFFLLHISAMLHLLLLLHKSYVLAGLIVYISEFLLFGYDWYNCVLFYCPYYSPISTDPVVSLFTSL